MKPYGVPVEEYPDVADIKDKAPKSSAGKLRKKGGDIPSYWKSSAKKRQTRRRWKKLARRIGKREIEERQ